MSRIEEARATIEQLIGEHRRLASSLTGWLWVLELSPRLREFADLLEAHIWTEERVLFPCYERNISPKEAGQVKIQVLEVIGSAMKLKNPVLLE
jgi:hemerythrin-like domain-containing protein